MEASLTIIMQQSRTEYLLQQYIAGSLSAEEREELLSLLEQPGMPMQEVLLERLSRDASTPIPLNDADTLRLFRNIVAVDSHPEALPVRGRLFSFRRYWVAASIVAALGAGAWLWLSQRHHPEQPQTAGLHQTEIQPGREGALLTLADGSKILLDTLRNGFITPQGGSTVRVVNGVLQYTGNGTASVTNTMSTPKGRQFRLTLPDGTQVWLNSASSLRYPTRFTGKERKVTITGEAYFEVAQNGQLPFRININDRAEVEVLGTHFNVNAYDNEASIATTLLQGSVRVISGQPGSTHAGQDAARQALVLKPGQQAQVLQTGAAIQLIENADIEKATAWKNGLFSFENVTLQEIMRQLERWYDIEVVYESTVPTLALMGEITRDVPLTDLLTALKKLGVRYRLEGRRLIVLP